MEQSFAQGLNFYKQFWVFVIGCFLGVVLETVWCLVRLRRFESRTGLIYGPFNLIYGFGALVMTLILHKLEGQRDLLIFACGSLIGGAYEYLCSYIQEKLLGTASWDYRNFPLNLNGRINLLYCFFWGLLALVWVKDAYPILSHIVENIPSKYGVSLTWICLIFMIFNSFMSACVVVRASCRRKGISANGRFFSYIDRHYPDSRVERIYPNMEFNTRLRR